MSTLKVVSLVALLAAPGPLHSQRDQAPPARMVSFTTNEGTWISLDVSPDGSTIAFELLGDIYTMPISGGAARPILTGTAFQSQPRFSPDGRSLAYVSDGSGSDNVWIAAANGSSPRQLSEIRRALVISPEWSRDGEAIFATVSESRAAADIWRFDVATGRGEKIIANQIGGASLLVSTPAPGGYSPHATPDGRSVMYSSVTPSVARSYVRAQSRVVRYDLATKQEYPVTLGVGLAMKPVVSPDGRWLLYGGQSEGVTGLRLRELVTGKERWLRRSLQRNELESRASRDVLPNYAFTPDGRAVVVAYDGKIHRIAVEGGEDRIIPFQADVSLEIAERIRFPQRVSDAPVRGRLVQHVALAADGRVAFSTLARVYVTDTRGGMPRRLTRSEHPREFMPAWSPDGQWVAFVTWGASGGDLWKVRADGGEAPVRLTTVPSLWVDPVWTPAGDSIVVIRGATSSSHAVTGVPPDAQLVIVPAAGGVPREVGAAMGARRPHFGGETRRVLAEGAGGLVSISLNDGRRRTVATVARGRGGFGAAPSAARVSPDGRQIALLHDERLYRLPMPPATEGAAAPPVLDPRDAASGATELGALAPTTFAWSPNGSSLVWVNGSRLTRVDAVSPGASPTSVALTVEVPRARPSGTVVLRGARVITMRGKEIIPRADVVVTDNRIAAIGAQGTTTLPPRARVMDVSGKVIVPGFVDVHAHLSQRHELPEPEGAAMYANLAYGTTTLRDPQTLPDVFAYADLIDAGESLGPRVYSTGPGVFADRDFTSYEETRRVLARYRDDYGTHLLKSYMVGNRQQRQWVVRACRELGIMPTTEGGADTKMDLTHAIDGFSGNEHSVPTTPVYHDVVELIARSGISYTPTLLVTFGGALPIYVVQPREKAYRNPKMRRFAPGEQLYPSSAGPMLRHPDEDYNYREAAAGANAIHAAGGRIALGGHGEMHGLQAHWEMGLLAEGGMAPHDVLRVATINGAEALGLDGELGSLEKGKLADLVVLDRDPLADIRNTTAIRYVMKNGVLYDDETLDQVWPEARPLPAPWWRVDSSAAQRRGR